jgi:hypothetical protein
LQVKAAEFENVEIFHEQHICWRANKPFIAEILFVMKPLKLADVRNEQSTFENSPHQDVVRPRQIGSLTRRNLQKATLLFEAYIDLFFIYSLLIS